MPSHECGQGKIKQLAAPEFLADLCNVRQQRERAQLI